MLLQLTFGSLLMLIALTICLGVIIGVGMLSTIKNADEEQQARERQAYLNAIVQLNLGSFEARRDLIASALEEDENSRRG